MIYLIVIGLGILSNGLVAGSDDKKRAEIEEKTCISAELSAMHTVEEYNYFITCNNGCPGSNKQYLDVNLHRLITENRFEKPCYVKIDHYTWDREEINSFDLNRFLVPLLPYLLISSYPLVDIYNGLTLVAQQSWANPNDLSLAGYGLLHAAVQLRHKETVKQVLQLSNINVNLRDGQGNTALKLVQMMRDQKYVEYTQSLGYCTLLGYSRTPEFMQISYNAFYKDPNKYCKEDSLDDLEQLLREHGATE